MGKVVCNVIVQRGCVEGDQKKTGKRQAPRQHKVKGRKLSINWDRLIVSGTLTRVMDCIYSVSQYKSLTQHHKQCFVPLAQ